MAQVRTVFRLGHGPDTDTVLRGVRVVMVQSPELLGSLGVSQRASTRVAPTEPYHYGAADWWRSLGCLQIPLRIAGKLRFARATHRGVQRGEAPLRSSSSPKTAGKGIEERW